jgi:anaerobic magnesium-protoporphyrin IX monomethyl ester cyclase
LRYSSRRNPLADIILVKLENEEESRNLAPPFGILFLADCLEKAGFSVQLVHEVGTRDKVQSVVDLVLKEKPLFVGFSTLTGPPLVPTIQASREIKRMSDVIIVWGGIHPTVLPEETLLNDFIDLVVIGEGEATIVELANVLHQKGLQADELEKVAGVAFKRNGQAVVTEPRPFIRDLDGIYPAWHHLDVRRYFLSPDYFLSGLGGERAVVLFTSRGCPWRCGFCYNQLANQRTFRAQSAERVLSEVHDLRERFDISAIVFEDDNFFSNRRRAIQVVRGLDVSWNSTIRVDEVVKGGEDLVRELSQNHCAELRIGVESGSPRILGLIDKDITLDQVRKTAKWCVKYGIVTNYMFMVGFPGETWSDIDQTLELMDELDGMDDTVHVRGPFAYVPFPGTPLFDLAIKHGFQPPGSLAGWSRYFFMGRKPSLPAYADKRIASIHHYRELATRKDLDQLAFSLPARLLALAAKFRYERRFFNCPIDHVLPSFGVETLNRIGLSAILKGIRPHLH